MALSAAERARLAHRVLRLRESGVTSDRHLSELARAELLRRTGNPRDFSDAVAKVRVGGSYAEALAGIALGTQNYLDSAAPGPTDERAVARMFDRSLTDLWKEWDAAVTENVQTHHPEDFKRTQRANEIAQRQHEEQVARMLETGDWPVHPYFGHLRHEAGAANALFDLGREGFLAGEIDWDTAAIKASLIDSADYTVNLATHKFVSSVTGAGIEETSGALTTKTVAAGVADADDVTFTAAAGDPCEAILLFQSSAVTGGADVANTAQRLIAYIDTATGLPVTLNGGNVIVTWDSGANRIFKL